MTNSNECSVETAAASSQVGQHDSGLDLPPGFAGTLATCLLNSAYTPVPLMATVGAVALLAGVCGRGYRTPTGKDLSLYINLVADSGTGKDIIHDGIPELLCYSGVSSAPRFLSLESFSHGVTLHKAVVQRPGLLSLQREWGRTLRKITAGDTIADTMRDVLTRLYGVNYFGGIEYSNPEKNIPGAAFPALTWLGETTPGTFLESLSSDMAEDGFMSRFLTFWYDGPRLYPNEDRFLILEDEDRSRWSTLIAHCLQWAAPGGQDVKAPIRVEYADAEEEGRFKAFERQCIDQINLTDDPYLKQAYNRAHLKALKVACVLAVADNMREPRIRCQHAAWARAVVLHDQASFARRNASGDVGGGDHARERKLKFIITDYLLKGAPGGYRIPPRMREAGIVPRKYLQIRTQRMAQFTQHRLDATAALDMALRSMVDSGYLAEESKDVLSKQFNFHGKCYRVLDLANP